MNTLETERLLLRPHTEADAADFVTLNSEAIVVQYTGDKTMHSKAEALDIFRNIVFPQYEKYDMGRLAVVLKSTGEYIGWCGIKYLEDEAIYDLGYRFMPKHWGKGYATEAAQASLNEGVTHYKLSKIIARAMPENIGSIKVMQHIGMQHLKTEIDEDGVVWEYYQLGE